MLCAARAGHCRQQTIPRRKQLPLSNPSSSGEQGVCTPIGRGSALRAHSVAVRVGPDAPYSRSVTHLVRRPDCLSGERDSISLRSANRV